MESDNPEMTAFTRTMRGLLAVTKEELNGKLKAYERNKKRRKARAASRAGKSRASRPH